MFIDLADLINAESDLPSPVASCASNANKDGQVGQFQERTLLFANGLFLDVLEAMMQPSLIAIECGQKLWTTLKECSGRWSKVNEYETVEGKSFVCLFVST